MNFEFSTLVITVVGSVLVPLFTQILKTPKMTRSVKYLITVALSLITGFVGYLLSGYKMEDIVVVITGVSSLSIFAYETFWKGVFDNATSRAFGWLNKSVEVKPEVKAEVKPVEVKKVKRNKK